MKLKYLLLSLMLIIPNIVSASEIYFKNNNGVELTKREYDYIVDRFSEKFTTIMTERDYNNLLKDELVNGDMNVVTNVPNIMPLAEDYYKTGSKYLKISSICNTSRCSIAVLLRWYKIPKIKSYDVIGAYFQNTSLVTTPITYITSSSGTNYSSDVLNQKGGFGVSLKVPSGDGIELYQYYDTEPSGRINASYQHAVTTVTLANSKKYTISNAGFGGVFLFDKSVRDSYDAMSGVSIQL